MIFDWSKRRKIEVYLHMLLAFDNDLAKAIVKSKDDWSGAALKAVKSGKKYGDVAASIILDMTDNVVRGEERLKREIVQELIDRRQFAELKRSSIVIAHVIANLLLYKEEEFSNSLGYDVANSYARLIAANREEEKLAVDRLLECALIAYKEIREAFEAATGKIGSKKTLDGIMEKHYEIMKWKVGAFVDRDYKRVTNDWLKSFQGNVDHLDAASVDFDRRLTVLVEEMRQTVFEINGWAWKRARALIDADLDFISAEFGDGYDGKIAGERLADLVEGVVEGHTKHFVQELGVIRTNKLNERRAIDLR